MEWAPRHRAFFRRFGAWRRRKKEDSRWDWIPDIPDFGGDNIIGAILLGLFAAIVAVLFLWWVVLPLLFLVIDALILLVLLVFGLGVRILLRRPWTVQARAGEHLRELEVTGWRRALRARDGMAAGLQTGGAPAWPSLALRRWDN